MKHRFPKITVEWADHWSTETNQPYTQQEIDAMARAVIRETNGYLVYEDPPRKKHGVIGVAGTIEEDGQATEITFFMRSAILHRSDRD